MNRFTVRRAFSVPLSPLARDVDASHSRRQRDLARGNGVARLQQRSPWPPARLPRAAEVSGQGDVESFALRNLLEHVVYDKSRSRFCKTHTFGNPRAAELQRRRLGCLHRMQERKRITIRYAGS